MFHQVSLQQGGSNGRVASFGVPRAALREAGASQKPGDADRLRADASKALPVFPAFRKAGERARPRR